MSFSIDMHISSQTFRGCLQSTKHSAVGAEGDIKVSKAWLQPPAIKHVETTK